MAHLLQEHACEHAYLALLVCPREAQAQPLARCTRAYELARVHGADDATRVYEWAPQARGELAAGVA